MAEGFINKIYGHAEGLVLLEEALSDMRRVFIQRASQKWNKAIEHITTLASCDKANGEALIRSAGDAKEAWGDPHAFSSAIREKVIPAYERCLKQYCTIDVSEGRYRLKSSGRAYLSLYDKEQDKWLHEPGDPMGEAYRLAEELYDPAMDEIHILGCGLGYLPYCLYRLSGGSIDIYLYEKDTVLLQYAMDFGVLSFIDSDCLRVITADTDEELVKEFPDDPEGHKRYISLWEAKELRCADGKDIAGIKMNDDASRWYKDVWTTNLRKNSRIDAVSVEKLARELRSSEWIIAAAGPGLDEDLELLKNRSAKCRLVAVDAVLKKLLSHGIRPDVVVAADPNDTLLGLLDGVGSECGGIPMVAGRMVNWRFARAYPGKMAFVAPENTVGEYGRDGFSDDEIWNIGGTVAALAIECAVRFGADKISCTGLDLAYPGKKYYADGAGVQAGERSDTGVTTESVDGGRVESTATFLFFKEQIEQQIAQYPEVRFINLSRHGALIKGMEKAENKA